MFIARTRGGFRTFVRGRGEERGVRDNFKQFREIFFWRNISVLHFVKLELNLLKLEENFLKLEFWHIFKIGILQMSWISNSVFKLLDSGFAPAFLHIHWQIWSLIYLCIRSLYLFILNKSKYTYSVGQNQFASPLRLSMLSQYESLESNWQGFRMYIFI